MADSGNNNSSGKLSTSFFTSKTQILGLQLYVVIAAVVVILVFVFVLIFLFLRLNRRSEPRRLGVKRGSGLVPLVAKEISGTKTRDRSVICRVKELEDKEKETKAILREDAAKVTDIESDDHKGSSGSNNSSTSQSSSSTDASNIGWGRWYSLKELETATRGFSSVNVIGEGGYGIVFRGVLPDGSVVAVKKLLNKGQVEKDFKVEGMRFLLVNLTLLEHNHAHYSIRLLVYEYINNGNLEQWLHGDVGPVSPLTWDIRMKIAIGTARGLAYLHEGLEPKVVHRDVKSGNILLDRKWNAKVSDFGLAKLLGSEKSYVTTRVMGTFGYVSPDYASTGMLNEGCDVYSFGILLMEIITGRSPVDYSRPPGEMNLVEWFKGMVANRRGEELVDPLVKVHPPPRILKRALLVCLRCIDLDANKRPKMGQIVNMLEADEFPFRAEPRTTQETAPLYTRTSNDRDGLATKDEVGDDEQKPSWRR
ncbi:PREDICTED: probable receptor-like serine/threonine-protein kinase At4g34500 isoform X2 [Ipomoea nil]|uniref:probable receptor-like serine/threonine-protein kinase At4g34500 isoform X2 n=1 Tax=Ipomoea nil TaxID=35883 RepID=UPI000900A685|nr:PREDICTED: probable receptor-like serine/threonine-protein kinase At4g34500 isoform X2 [Ipomoea nil]